MNGWLGSLSLKQNIKEVNKKINILKNIKPIAHRNEEIFSHMNSLLWPHRCDKRRRMCTCVIWLNFFFFFFEFFLLPSFIFFFYLYKWSGQHAQYYHQVFSNRFADIWYYYQFNSKIHITLYIDAIQWKFNYTTICHTGLHWCCCSIWI